MTDTLDNEFTRPKNSVLGRSLLVMGIILTNLLAVLVFNRSLQYAESESATNTWDPVRISSNDQAYESSIGIPIEFDFTINNVSQEPILVRALNASCSCTNVNISSNLIFAGSSTAVIPHCTNGSGGRELGSGRMWFVFDEGITRRA
jgi:hypothetical protein